VDSPSSGHHLKAFQSSGRKEDLLACLQAEGRDPADHLAAFEGLEEALRPLFFGLRPAPEDLDRRRLGEHATATTEILHWLAGSPKADLKTAAIELMGGLGWETFVPHLERALSSPASWERMTALRSLARLPGSRAAELVRRAVDDPDPAVSAAARELLDPRGQTRPDGR
jgi:hypothetical protein